MPLRALDYDVVGGHGVVGLLPKWSVAGSATASGGTLADSHLKDGVSGSYLAEVAATLTGNRQYTLQDADMTLAAINLAQNWSAAQTFRANLIVSDGTNTATYSLASSEHLIALSGCYMTIQSDYAGPTLYLTRTTSTTNAGRSVFSLQAVSTGDMADGFGPLFSLQIRDNAGASNTIAEINAVRDGADNTGKMQLCIYNAGSLARKFIGTVSGTMVGYGILSTTTLAAPFHVYNRDTATNTVSETAIIEHDSSATPAAGFGARLGLYLKSSTTSRQLAAAIDAVWTTATHASRTAKIIFSPILSAVETVRLVIANTIQLGDIAGGNYAEFESDGTLKLVGTATVWDDLQFPTAIGKIPGSNAPTWENFTTNTAEYAFSVDDYIDLQAGEPPHGWKEGSTSDIHAHLTLKSANTSGSNRYIKITVYVALADNNAAWSELSAISAEWTVPTGTAAKTHYLLDLGDVTLTGYHVGMQIKVRLKRVAATGGTEYADDVYISQVGMHMEQERIGSHSEYSA